LFQAVANNQLSRPKVSTLATSKVKHWFLGFRFVYMAGFYRILFLRVKWSSRAREVGFRVCVDPVFSKNSNHILVGRWRSPVDEAVDSTRRPCGDHHSLAGGCEAGNVFRFQFVEHRLPNFRLDRVRAFNINSRWSDNRVHSVLRPIVSYLVLGNYQSVLLLYQAEGLDVLLGTSVAPLEAFHRMIPLRSLHFLCMHFARHGRYRLGRLACGTVRLAG
jgi:hypothetical protein